MWKESWCWNAAGTPWLHHSLPSSAVGFCFTRIPSPNQVFNFSTRWAPARWGDKNEQGTELELAAALRFLFTLYFPLPRVMVKHRLCCSAPFGVVSVAWRFVDLQRVIMSTPSDLPFTRCWTRNWLQLRNPEHLRLKTQISRFRQASVSKKGTKHTDKV